MKTLVTGAAGFVGHHLVQRLIKEGHQVVGIDLLNNYYDVKLKHARLTLSGVGVQHRNLVSGETISSVLFPNYRFIYGDISDKGLLMEIFAHEKFDLVVNLAAQAGVRYSLENPDSYVRNNVTGFYNLLECCRSHPVRHFLYASSSSVYGNSVKTPFEETDPTDEPVSLYAARKKSNELMAYTYGHLFQVPTTGLRFFTVYGPWGRPDMAYFGFTKSILEGQPISLFNGGDMYRDFTYVDDIIEAVFRLLDNVPAGKQPARILNLGNSNPIFVKDMIAILEDKLGQKAVINNLPMQDTDVYITYASTAALEQLTGFAPATRIEDGLRLFCDWYQAHYETQRAIS